MKPRLHCARLALFLCGCAAFLNLYATQSILQTFAAQFQISAKAAGWSITVTTLAVAITAPFVSRLTGRFEQRTVICVAALLLAVPALMTAYADSFTEVLVWRFVEGMVIPVVFATSVAYIGDRWSGGTVTEVTSLYVAGTVLGGFAGRFVTGVMTEYVGWREAFELLAALSLMVVTLVATAAVHWPADWHTLSELAQGYAISNKGYGNFKLPLIYLVTLTPLLLSGAGKLSLDALLTRYFWRR